jgi:hypothetical protein
VPQPAARLAALEVLVEDPVVSVEAATDEWRITLRRDDVTIVVTVSTSAPEWWIDAAGPGDARAEDWLDYEGIEGMADHEIADEVVADVRAFVGLARSRPLRFAAARRKGEPSRLEWQVEGRWLAAVPLGEDWAE